MNDIIFNRGEGGLGRALAGEDHICGFIAYFPQTDIPIELNDKIAVLYSFAELESYGIVSGDSDAATHLAYEIKMLFEANSKAVVYLAVKGLLGTGEIGDPYGSDLSYIVDLQRFSEGKIRQAGVLNHYIDFEVGQVVSLQEACDILEAEHKPLSVVYSAKTLTNSVSSLPDLRAQDAKNVSVVIGADGAGLGYDLNQADDVYPTILGLAIGVLSTAKVNENIGWVGRFNVAKNSINEFDVPALNLDGGGLLVKTLAPSAIQTLNDKGYIFLLKHIGTAGSYFNDSHTAKVVTSDYAYIENNRTIDKAVRGVRTFLLPSLNAPLYVNNDGTLTEDTIAGFKNDALRALEQMEREGEISAKSVVINPAQNVLSSSKLQITIKIVPVGVARNIEVNIGFAVKIK